MGHLLSRMFVLLPLAGKGHELQRPLWTLSRSHTMRRAKSIPWSALDGPPLHCWWEINSYLIPGLTVFQGCLLQQLGQYPNWNIIIYALYNFTVDNFSYVLEAHMKIMWSVTHTSGEAWEAKKSSSFGGGDKGGTTQLSSHSWNKNTCTTQHFTCFKVFI